MSRDAVICLALASLTLLLYAPVRHHEFVDYDDPGYVQQERVRQGLTLENVRWAFTTFTFSNYHPLTWLSHMLDVSLFGHRAGGHHLTSAALHALNAVVLYLLLAGMTGRAWESLAVAALWSAHPLRVESVAWVAERKDLLCALFFFLSIWCYARYAKQAGRPRGGAYAASLLCFALALLSKSMAVTLPCVLLLLDFWPLRRQERWKILLLEKVPFFLLTIGFSLVTVIAQRQGGAMAAGESYPLMLRLGNAVVAYGRYVELTFWPRGLAVFYPYYGALPGTRLPTVGLLVGLALLLIVTLLLTWLARRGGATAPLVGWLWFIGMLVPTIGLVQVGFQSMADRYTYLPQIGLLIAVVWGALAVIERRRKLHLPVAGLATAFVIALSVLTLNQLRHWRDSRALFEHALRVTDRNHVAHASLGLWWTERQDYARAIEHYRRVIEIDPDQPQGYYNIGRIYLLQGDYARAREWFERALQQDPEYAEAHSNLARAFAGLGDRPAAVRHFGEVVRLRPSDALAHYDLAVELAESGDVDAALPRFETATRLGPDIPQLHYAYSLALQQAGRRNEARAAHERYQELARGAGQQVLPFPATNPHNRSSESR